MTNIFNLVGILNVTTDSFTDGGLYLDPKKAIEKGHRLITDGADIIDIGGDSTRPGSKCVGEDTEWQRIESVVTELSKKIKVSVDTHFISTARKAIHAGSTYINDISGGSNEMYKLCADTNTTLIAMYSTSKKPHIFLENSTTNVISEIQSFFDKSLEKAHGAGLPLDRLILDPGMGAFISKDSNISFEILFKLKDFLTDCSLMLGVSRKGFLKKYLNDGEENSKDGFSAFIGVLVSRLLSEKQTSRSVYLRVHNPSIHSAYSRFWLDWQEATRTS